MLLPSSPDRLRYAICDHRWHGLDIVDYSLLSLLAYMDPKSGRHDVDKVRGPGCA